MAIYQDMQVYAKWNSNAMRPYIIHYAIEGSDVEIGASTVWVADLSEGSGLVGTTKTFEAKGPEELYDGYQHHYFPLVRSHSFVLSLDGENEYTFKYVPREVIPYTVRYVDEKGNDLAEPKVVSENTHAVVTETSIGISDYKADAYQKRLIVVADEALKDTNVITFVYTKVEGEQAREFYGISHYIQTLNGGWMEYQYSVDIGDIGATQTAVPISPADLPGFTYDESISTPSGTLVLGGIHLQLYYKRNSYPYTIYYLDSENENAEPLQIITGSALYESMVTGNAIAIDGYELVGEGTKSITIRVDTATDENGTPLNQIIFYYRKETTEFKYEVVGPVGCGTVSVGAERVTADGTGIQPTDSQALAARGYQFVGWFKDADGLYPVDDTEGSLSGDGSHFVPGIKNGAYTGRTYYAKFEASLTSLTISKTGSADQDEDQSFLFRVYSAEQGIDVTVAILGNNSVTIKELPIGTYSITELTGWSWRYTPDQPERTVEVKAGQDNGISFSNSRTGLYWLDGNDSRENTFQ